MKFLIFASVLFLTVSVYGDWVTSQWKECSAVCDGVQVRKVYCKNPVTGEVAPDSLCDAKPKPATSQPCSPPCTYEWLAGEWGECSEVCGPGFQSRGVQCIQVETSATVIDSYCDSASMPALTQPCNDLPCGDEDIADEDPVDGDLIDEDLFEGEADEDIIDEDIIDEDIIDEDIIDIDAIFVDEDTADNETIVDETVDEDLSDDLSDEVLTEAEDTESDETVDNEAETDIDTTINDDAVTDETTDTVSTDENNDSGCGCDVIGL